MPVAEWATPENLARARSLWDDGVSINKIAMAIGVSKNAMCGMKDRQGWPKRENPVKRRDPSEIGPETPYQKAVRRHQARRYLVEPPPLAVERKQRVASSHRLFGPLAPPKKCAWPLWGIVGENAKPLVGKLKADPRPGCQPLFCAAPSHPGQPYCLAHCRIAMPRQFPVCELVQVSA